MMTINAFISALIGYAFGCIQSAFLLGKLFGRLDIREHGSGNAGASNVTSTMGLKYGIIVGLIDILKGMFAVILIKWIYPESPELAYLSGLMAILGHMFPFYMRFRGGKGVATLVGMMIGMNWKLGLLFALLVIIPALLTDYIVSGSFTTFIALPIVSFLHGYPTLILVLSLVLTGLCFYLHRYNIQRIRAGEELKIRAVLFKKK
ncbi:MAG: glycerol-3-phosphate 1-O-acyltransferase PlsY [Anaerolineaceae bacterium]|nr:glycerol-3-phosphate 1-O-acyltransferase PlsY [Anaerolineaceae bacterium]